MTGPALLIMLVAVGVSNMLLYKGFYLLHILGAYAVWIGMAIIIFFAVGLDLARHLRQDLPVPWALPR